MIEPSSSSTDTAAPSRKKYPRWRLVVGALLLLAAGAHYLSTAYHPAAQFPYLDHDPDPIEVSTHLKQEDTVEFPSGLLKGANLLVITLDTTRADGLACYGRERIKTATLDAFADRGILFTRATAVAPVTLPTHTSIMTGLYPVNHGVRANGFYRLDDSKVTLAEVLSEQGYKTGAIVSAFVLDSQFGLHQGFQTYEDDLRDGEKPNSWSYRQRSAQKTTDRAVNWIKSASAGGAPFMLWVHYFDPHAAYDPPSPFLEEYATNRYLGEIAYVDSQLARIAAQLQELGIEDTTLVVVVGDHGESLGQHDELSHGFLAYEATVRVPFIMSCGTRLGGGVAYNRRVSQVDVAPTVLALLGVDAPAEMDGGNVLATDAAERPVFCETLHGTLTYGFAPLLGVYSEEYKYLHGPSSQLFALANDPNERNDITSANPSKAKELREALVTMFGDDLGGESLITPPDLLSPADAAKLEALGYAGSPTRVDMAAVRPDPRTIMPAMRRLEQIIYVDDTRTTPEKQIADLEQLTADYPEFHPAFRHLGDAYNRAEEFEKAKESYARCLELSPDLTSMYALARIHARQDDAEGAIAIANRLIATYPDHLPTRMVLAGIASTQGRHSDSADQYRYIFEADPDYRQPAMPMCAIQVVQAHLIAGRADELPDMLKAVLNRHPKSPGARAALANYYVHTGATDQAEQVLRDGVKLAPDSPAMAANLAVLLCQMPADGSAHRMHEGLLIMEELCQADQYKDAELLGTLSVLYSIAGRRDDGIATAKRAKALAEATGNLPLARSLEMLMIQQQTAPPGGDVIHPSVFVPGG